MFVTLTVAILTTLFTCTINQTQNPTLKPHEAVDFQNWYMERIVDTLPLLETISDCQCPRVYIPVCGSDNKTYTNICWMNCMNLKRGTEVDAAYEVRILLLLLLSSEFSTRTTRRWTTKRPIYQILPPLNRTVPCNQCPNVYFPVCTTTNETFINVCQMNCQKKNLKVARRGICIDF